MKRLLSICLALFLAFTCIAPVYATETTETTTIELPELPDLRFDEPYPNYYNVYKVIFKVNSDYYAVIYEEPINRASETAYYGLSSTDSGCRISMLTYVIRYAETYKLSAAGTWDLIYETGSANVSEDKSSEIYLSGFVDFTLEDWQHSWASRDLVCFCSREKAGVSKKTGYSSSTLYYQITEDVLGDITFIDPDEGGSSEGGGFNGGWSDEDKGWLGNLFDDLFSFFNNWWSTKIQPKLDSITTSIGNFIDNAVSSVGNFFNNLTSTITGLFNTLSTWIDNARTKLEEFFTGIWDSVKDWWLNTVCVFWEEKIQGIKDWWSELWKPVEEWFAEQKELKEQKDQVSEELNQSFESLFDTLIEVKLKPIVDFFDSLSEGAIMIWLMFFDLPFIRELALGVIVVAIFSGILTLLLTF